jgi:uncharacterized membrane protein YgcG
MRLLESAQIQDVELVYLPFSMLSAMFGSSADHTLLLHERRRRLALSLGDASTKAPLPRTGDHDDEPADETTTNNGYDDSTVSDSLKDEVIRGFDSPAVLAKLADTRAAMNEHDDDDFSGSSTREDLTTVAVRSMLTLYRRSDSPPLPQIPSATDDAGGEPVPTPDALRHVSESGDTPSDHSRSTERARPLSSRSRARRAAKSNDAAVSSDGAGDSITSSLGVKRFDSMRSRGGDDDDDQSSLSTPQVSAPAKLHTSSNAAVPDVVRDAQAVMLRSPSAPTFARPLVMSPGVPASATPAPATVASLGQRQQKKLQQMLGDEVALAGESASTTELAIEDVLTTVAGASKAQLRKPWRTFLMTDDLTELEAPRDGNAKEQTPISALKMLRVARYYLFSDILLRCWPTPTSTLKYQLHDTISLDSVLLVDLDADVANTTFQIVVMGGLRGSEKLTLRAHSPAQKRHWLHYLTAIVERKLSTLLRSYKSIPQDDEQEPDLVVVVERTPSRAAALLGLVRGTPAPPAVAPLPIANAVQKTDLSRSSRRRSRRSPADADGSNPSSPRSKSPHSPRSKSPHSPRSPRSKSPHSPRSKSPRARSPHGRSSRGSSGGGGGGGGGGGAGDHGSSSRRSKAADALSSLLRPRRKSSQPSAGAEFSLRVTAVGASDVPTSRRECTTCHSWLSGDVLLINGHFYHRSCPACTSCSAPLDVGTCYLDPAATQSPAPAPAAGDAPPRASPLLCTDCFVRLIKSTRSSSDVDKRWLQKATSATALHNAITNQTTKVDDDVASARRHAKLQRMLDDNQPVVRRHRVAVGSSPTTPAPPRKGDGDQSDLSDESTSDDDDEGVRSSNSTTSTSSFARASLSPHRLSTTRLPARHSRAISDNDSEDIESAATERSRK